MILRPGQKFMKSERELKEFLNGYMSTGNCNLEYVKYYMALIYARFIQFGDDEYEDFIRKWYKDNLLTWFFTKKLTMGNKFCILHTSVSVFQIKIATNSISKICPLFTADFFGGNCISDIKTDNYKIIVGNWYCLQTKRHPIVQRIFAKLESNTTQLKKTPHQGLINCHT